MDQQYHVYKEDYELAKQLVREMEKRPAIIQNDIQLTGLLADVLKGKQLEFNILRILLKEGMLDELRNQKTESEAIYNRYVLLLRQRYAMAEDVARRMAWVWLYCYASIIQKKTISYQILSKPDSCISTSQNNLHNNTPSSVIKDQQEITRSSEHVFERQPEHSSHMTKYVGEHGRVKKNICPACGFPVREGDRYCPAGHPVLIQTMDINLGESVRLPTVIQLPAGGDN